MRVAGRLPDDAGRARGRPDLRQRPDAARRPDSPALGGGWDGRYVGASLDHAVWFHAPVRADEWFLYETDSPAATGGRALCFGQIWAADGTHVATVAQQGLIRSLER